MSTGDLILYVSLAVGLIAILLLFKKDNFDRPIKWMIRVFVFLLLTDFLLLTYYFVTTNLTINYVWSYTSKDLTLLYKLSGVLAGQQGTLLYWALLIAIGSLWLNERYELTDFIKGTQIIVLSLGLYFIGLTLLESPFQTIYEIYPDISESFVPADGSGLNPLLIDPWIALHPPVIFIAYAAMTVPFALATVYLYKSIKKDSKDIYKIWIRNAVQWSRVSWLFLTLAIAFGGVWSYKVLGWGGFWAWDPVETSSLIPWLLLTGTLHVLIEHRRDEKKYSVLAPALVIMSFVLVIYATLVTRSGFFESIHAFGSGKVGSYFLILIAVLAFFSLILTIMKYLKVEDKEREDEASFVNMTNIFYITILLFIILTFISFWGVTFPAIVRLLTGNKYGVGMAFYNIWSYPFFIGLMLLGGLGLNYKSSNKEELIKRFIFFMALTLIAAFLKPSDAWNIVDYSAIVSPEKPLLYNFIGSISVLTIIPPSIYMVYSLIERGRSRIKSLKKGYEIKELGTIILHAGVVFIVIGSVFSSMFTEEFSVSVNKKDKDIVYAYLGDTPYGVRLLEYKEYVDYEEVDLSNIPGMSLAEFYIDLDSGPIKEMYTVRGFVEDTINVGMFDYVKLVEGEKELWLATEKSDVSRGVRVIATGILMQNFSSPSLNKTFDLLMFSPDIQPYQKSISSTQQVEVAVYRHDNKIGEGIAKKVQYKQGDVNRVMIDRGAISDVYVIFSGTMGNEIPLTVKILPLVNYLWFGIILFVVGISMILFFDPRYRKR